MNTHILFRYDEDSAGGGASHIGAIGTFDRCLEHAKALMEVERGKGGWKPDTIEIAEVSNERHRLVWINGKPFAGEWEPLPALWQGRTP